MFTDAEREANAHVSRCPECARTICAKGHNLRVRVLREVERWLQDRAFRAACEEAIDEMDEEA